MDLEFFRKKYPFLEGNLVFWEKYITAREEVLKLLPAMLDDKVGGMGDFAVLAAKGRELLAETEIRLSAEETGTMAEAFCHAMGIVTVTVDFGDVVPLFEELSYTVDTAGFVKTELHALICAYLEELAVGDSETGLNWLELSCPICGAAAGMGLLDASGKKNLICSHCQCVWIYLRSACGLCGHSAEKGMLLLTAEEEQDWSMECCEECGHYLKVYDMRRVVPYIINYPLHYLTSWNLDVSMQGQGYEPAFFYIFERAGWLGSAH